MKRIHVKSATVILLILSVVCSFTVAALNSLLDLYAPGLPFTRALRAALIPLVGSAIVLGLLLDLFAWYRRSKDDRED